MAYQGTTPTYWLEAEDVLIVTALDVLDQRAAAAAKERKARG